MRKKSKRPLDDTKAESKCLTDTIRADDGSDERSDDGKNKRSDDGGNARPNN
ncbi:MAG: hypothetical protein ACOYL3_10580 [Desulfuromonadaceae bacterium]